MKVIQYDLVLMDCEMLVLDGFFVIEQFCVWEVYEQCLYILVVVFIVYIFSEYKECVWLVGMDGYMVKLVELL